LRSLTHTTHSCYQNLWLRKSTIGYRIMAIPMRTNPVNPVGRRRPNLAALIRFHLNHFTR